MSSEGQEHLGKIYKQELKLGNGKSYASDDKTGSGSSKCGFVQQALTRVVVRKEVGGKVPQRPTKRHRDITNDGRKPRLLTKQEVQHAEGRRAKINA